MFNGVKINIGSGVFFPTFWQRSNICQMSREINFYRYTPCPNENIYVPFTATVTIYAGDKVFKWENAEIQWKLNISLMSTCPNETWGKTRNPTNIVIHLRPKTSNTL
jgi:hypothetical protein